MKKTLVRLLLLCLWSAAPLLAVGTNSALNLPWEQPVVSGREIPFKEVIQSTTGHRIVDFDARNPAHVALRNQILKAAQSAAARAAKDGLFAKRANEAGNHMEPFVRRALAEAGLSARIPVNHAGRAQAAGYPDIEIQGDPPCYLELKTYSARTANTTQRSFYYSPSEHPKVTRDALHLLLAFELEPTNREGQTGFVPVHWKLLTLQNLTVKLKFEFNQSNRELYGRGSKSSLLAEGKLE